MSSNLAFPVDLTPDDDVIMARFPDFPGATFGDDAADAVRRAVDLLETNLAYLVTNQEAIPAPSPAKGRPVVQPGLLISLKASLYKAMKERSWRKADLARALNQDPRQIDRLIDPGHKSTIAQLETALAVCGKRAEVAMIDIAA
jgi:antitoxin HicB